MSLSRAEDAALATSLANEAGRVLLNVRRQLSHVNPSVLRAKGDQESHEYLVERLRVTRPLDAVLSEEAADDAGRLATPRVWIIDPLDGTREFGEPGRTDWAVHVALAERERVVCAAVALPALGMTLSTADPPTCPPRPRGPVRLVVSRSRPPAFVASLAGQMDAEVVPMGSAGAKAAAVLTGAADVYVHAGGQYEWDVAAPAGVAVAAGFHASRIDGSHLRFNQPNPWSPDLLICRPDLAEQILTVLTAAQSGG